MRRLIILIACAIVGVCNCTATAVLVANANLTWTPGLRPRVTHTPRPDGSVQLGLVHEEAYGAYIFQDIAGTDYTGATFVYSEDPASTKRLWLTGVLTDEGADWYLVAPGTEFGADAIENGSLTRLQSELAPSASSLVVPDTFYLGVATRRGWTSSPTYPPPTDIYGWLQIRHNDDGTLAMVENAVSYHSRGIVVGTSTELPEPAALMAVGGLVLLGMRRSRPMISRPSRPPAVVCRSGCRCP